MVSKKNNQTNAHYRAQNRKAISLIEFVEPVAATIRLAPISKKNKPKVVACIDAIIELFGVGGKNWVQADYKVEAGREWDGAKGEYIARKFDAFCLSGAAAEANGPYEPAARAAITLAVIELYAGSEAQNSLEERDVIDVGFIDVEDEITSFNDDDGTTWADVRKVLNRAKKLVMAS